MDGRKTNPVTGLNRSAVRVCAQVVITAGTPGAITGLGVTSVTRTAAGKYTIQFDDAWTVLLSPVVTLQTPLATGISATEIKDSTLGSASAGATLKFNTMLAAAIADTTGVVYIDCTFQNTDAEG